MNIGKVFGKILGKSKKKKVINPEDDTKKAENIKEDSDLFFDEEIKEKITDEKVPDIEEKKEDITTEFVRSASGDEPSEIKTEGEEEEEFDIGTAGNIIKKKLGIPLDEDPSREKYKNRRRKKDTVTPYKNLTSTINKQTLEMKKDNSREEFRNKICQLLDYYMNSTEDDDTLGTNREDVKSSVETFIDSFVIQRCTEDASQQTEPSGQINPVYECSIEQCQSITTSSKKIIDFDSTASMNFLTNEMKSISFNLDKNCGGESLLSVLNAVQMEFMRMKIAEQSALSDGFLKSNTKLQENYEAIQEKSQSKIQIDSQENSAEVTKKSIMSDRDHLNNIFDYLHERIHSLLQYEKDTIATLGQLALDLQQFCTLIDLLKQWSDHKLNKLSNSIGKLKNYVNNVFNSPINTENSQRKVKIVLVRKSNSTI